MLLYRLCVCVYAHARTHIRQRLDKIRHKKRSAKNSTPFITFGYVLNVESVTVLMPDVCRIDPVSAALLCVIYLSGGNAVRNV